MIDNIVEIMWCQSNVPSWQKNQETHWIKGQNTTWIASSQTNWIQNEPNPTSNFYNSLLFYPAG